MNSITPPSGFKSILNKQYLQFKKEAAIKIKSPLIYELLPKTGNQYENAQN